MPTAEIITIGTELLLGEIVDTNTRTLARALSEAGVDLYRTTTVGDNVARIAAAIRESLTRAEVILTTGGLGPTVDDPTRAAVAQACDVALEFRPELWEQIQARFQRYGRTPTENNRRQAYVPQGAIAVENQVGSAPAFIVERQGRAVIALPGVPREMEHLLEHAVLPYLHRRYGLCGTIRSHVLHVTALGESQVDELVADLETGENPTVGLLAHPGQVDIRVAAKATSAAEAERMIAPVIAEIRRRLGEHIYGMDGDRLEHAALAALASRGLRLAVVEAGLGGGLVQRLRGGDPAFVDGEVVQGSLDDAALQARSAALRAATGADVILCAALRPAGEKQDLFVLLDNPGGARRFERSYGGPPQSAATWAANLCLDILRLETGRSAASHSDPPQEAR